MTSMSISISIAEDYIRKFGIDPDLLTKIIEALHVNLNDHLNDEYKYIFNTDAYFGALNDLIKILNDNHIYDKTIQTFILIYFYLCVIDIFQGDDHGPDHNTDAMIDTIYYIVINYYTTHYIIYDNSILLYINHMLFNIPYYKYLFIHCIIFDITKYTNYNFLILLDYLFIMDCFTNLRCYPLYMYPDGSSSNMCNHKYIDDDTCSNDCFYSKSNELINTLKADVGIKLRDAPGLMVQKLTAFAKVSEIRFLWIKWVYFNLRFGYIIDYLFIYILYVY